jgi:hypothetical protein
MSFHEYLMGVQIGIFMELALKRDVNAIKKYIG